MNADQIIDTLKSIDLSDIEDDVFDEAKEEHDVPRSQEMGSPLKMVNKLEKIQKEVDRIKDNAVDLERYLSTV